MRSRKIFSFLLSFLYSCEATHHKNVFFLYHVSLFTLENELLLIDGTLLLAEYGITCRRTSNALRGQFHAVLHYTSLLRKALQIDAFASRWLVV